MSELQDSLLIALLTGLFTLGGISIGTLLEHWREKWQYNREKEKRQKEMEDEDRRNYLSPLHFYLHKTIVVPFSGSTATMTDLNKELISLGKLKDTIESIEELMKNNMHVLPKELNLSLTYYILVLKEFLIRVGELSKTINDLSEKEKGTKVRKGFLEGFAKLLNTFNDMRTSLSTPIYAYMKFGVSPKQEPFGVDEKTKEVSEIVGAMKASLVSESEKNSERDTK